MIEYRAASIGQMAFQVLSENREAFVIGTTSHGVFIRAGDRIIFISFEAYRGPLTLTLNPPTDRLRTVHVGASATIASGRLVLPAADTLISAEHADVWCPSDTACPVRTPDERFESRCYLAREVLACRGDVGFGALLMLPTILQLRESLCRGLSYAAEIACGLLGTGRGLTPSGDDVVMGLLLMLNRWQAALWPDGDLDPLNRRVVESAYTRTTTLSANLIECAALGLADERLINVADCILTGSPRESECVPHVLGWGASSGIDALVGMALAVTC